MPPGTLFQLMGPWYANARCPYDFVLATAMLKIFGSNNERSGLAGVYTFNSILRSLLIIIIIIIIITKKWLEYTHSKTLTDILDMQ